MLSGYKLFPLEKRKWRTGMNKGQLQTKDAQCQDFYSEEGTTLKRSEIFRAGVNITLLLTHSTPKTTIVVFEATRAYLAHSECGCSKESASEVHLCGPETNCTLFLVFE